MLKFEELGKDERKVLLKAFGYNVDEENFILDIGGSRIPSQENPEKFLTVENSMLRPGSLKVEDGTATSISRLIREKMEDDSR